MATKLMFGVLAVLMMVGVAGYIFYDKLTAGATQASSIVDTFNRVCPESPKIQDYAKRIASYAAQDAPVHEPAYAVDIFEEYYACTHQADLVFTLEEIEKYEPGIISCAMVAYVSYVAELQAKYDAVKDSKIEADVADAKYYKELLDTYTRKKALFDFSYGKKASPEICNYNMPAAAEPVPEQQGGTQQVDPEDLPSYSGKMYY